LFTLALLFLSLAEAHAMAEPAYRIGVLASRSKAASVAAFQPTVDHLNRSSYGLHFELVPVGMAELAEAVAGRRVDFILTSPEQFVDLQARYRVSGVASLVKVRGGIGLRENGGVILVRGDRTDLVNLRDLRGKSIATGERDSLTGFLAQAGELADAGIDMRHDSRLETDLTPEQVVQAVASSQVDAGFLSAGIVEAMAGEGRVRLDGFRAVNRQPSDRFPFLLSTRLYPDWTFASLAHIPEAPAKQVATVLLAMKAASVPPWQGGAIEWTLPLGLESVHQLMRSLRLPPYDKGESSGFRDVLRKYEFETFALLTIVSTLLIVVLVRLRRLNHQLAGQMMQTYQRRRELEDEIGVRQRAESRLAGANAILASLAAGLPLAVVLERLIAMHEKERPGRPVAVLLFDAEQRSYLVAAHGNIDANFMRDIEGAAAIIASDGSPGPGMSRLCKRCGSMLTEPVVSDAGVRLGCLLIANPASESERELVGGMASLAALSIQRADAANRLRLNASVFENALEGVIVADPAGNIIDINDAFTRLTGYGRADSIGKNPRFLKSGRHDKEFYVRMWASLTETGEWQGEIWNRRKDGEVIVEMLRIAGIRNSTGQVTHYVGTFSDITLLKEVQARLSRATYGTTDWPT
jgi:PAS domain S-box-containing protein